MAGARRRGKGLPVPGRFPLHAASRVPLDSQSTGRDAEGRGEECVGVNCTGADRTGARPDDRIPRPPTTNSVLRRLGCARDNDGGRSCPRSSLGSTSRKPGSTFTSDRRVRRFPSQTMTKEFAKCRPAPGVALVHAGARRRASAAGPGRRGTPPGSCRCRAAAGDTATARPALSRPRVALGHGRPHRRGEAAARRVLRGVRRADPRSGVPGGDPLGDRPRRGPTRRCDRCPAIPGERVRWPACRRTAATPIRSFGRASRRLASDSPGWRPTAADRRPQSLKPAPLESRPVHSASQHE